MTIHDGTHAAQRRSNGSRLFWMLLAIGALCAVSFVGWVLLDAGSPLAVRVTLWTFGVGPHSSEDVDSVYSIAGRWESLGPRIVGASCLIAVAIACIAAALVQLIRGRGRPNARLRCWSFGGAACLYGVVVLTYPWIEWQGVQLRSRRVLSQFSQAANSLRNDWPQEAAEIPGAGRGVPDPEDSSRLLLYSRGYPFKESFGAVVRRSEKPPRIHFSLAGAPNCCLEYTPNADPPRSYRLKYGQVRQVRRWTQLDEEWQLVEYRLSLAE